MTRRTINRLALVQIGRVLTMDEMEDAQLCRNMSELKDFLRDLGDEERFPCVLPSLRCKSR